jgi:4-alpha-glucanotransferase
MESIDPGRWGVSTGYHDVSGAWRPAPDETVNAILEAMGAVPGDPPPPAAITVRTDHQLPPLGPGTVVLEGGGEVPAGGPEPLPPGYHLLRPDEGPERPLIVSPGRVPVPAGRTWGFAVQLYATRSKRSWGIGDLSDLEELARWSARVGAGFTLVNPLHAPASTERPEASPYYPGSRCFMNPLYIAVPDVPGAGRLDRIDELARAGRQLNSDRLIDRDRVWQLKSQALEALFEGSDSDDGFARYLHERGPALRRFAAFCALAERHGTVWRDWPSELRHPEAAGVASFVESPGGSRRVRYHSWLQWLLDGQADKAAAQLGLVADLAVGVDPSGPDSWIFQDSFAQGMRVGAPPDEFNTLGQDWGLPPFDPWRLRAGGYTPWIEALRSGFRHGAGLRIDHVMGLFRLFWLPEGGDARSGAYVRYPHDDMLNILALEADRAGAYVVGEDLGTVEDEVRHDLAERRVLSYRVWWFEDRDTSQWPEAAMGAVTTHDLPTVAGMFTGSDLDAQRRIGMEPNEESSAALFDKLVGRTGSTADSPPAEVIAGVYGDLATAPCLLLTVSLDDVLAVEERPNMPGTTEVWPNWSLALPETLEDLEENPLAARIAAELNGRDRC